jgi:Rrf2 family protein
MKLSTKGRYGVRFMLDLALHAAGRNVTLKEISDRQAISEKYLWQIVSPLKQHGLIQAVAGPGGGYALTRSADSITLGEILTVLEGGAVLNDCMDDGKPCRRLESCAAGEMWAEVNRGIAKVLNAFTLGAMVERQHRLDGERSPNYSI